MPQMTYALKNGLLEHVSNVESGLACGCVCPSCGGKLEAKKGAKQAHHFAHYNAEECRTGYETSLHLLVKDILGQCKTLLLPPLYLKEKEPNWKIYDSQSITFSSIEIEKTQGDFIPDVIGYIGQRKLLIEIRVFHAIDERKQAKIQSSDTSCVEVDLSKFDKEITRDDLFSFLTSDCSKTKWVYNSLQEKYRRVLGKYCERIDLVYRGYALHASTCPIPLRLWKGIPYANFMEDCAYCEYLQDYKSREPGIEESTGFLICSGRQKIGSFQDLKTALNKPK